MSEKFTNYSQIRLCCAPTNRVPGIHANLIAIDEAQAVSVQDTVDELCKTHTEEALLLAISNRCRDLAEQMESEGNRDAGFYWKTLHQKLHDVLKTCTG